jgi:hypothetical protein
VVDYDLKGVMLIFRLQQFICNQWKKTQLPEINRLANCFAPEMLW